MRVALLSGGTGGAKLARGLADVAQLTVIANVGDDIEIYGAHVSPDPDLVTYWLADRIDTRGWGLAGDTFAVMEGLRELGADVWFHLGDRDLAVCVERARLLAEGATLSDAIARMGAAFGVAASVVPASDDPVRTEVRSGNRTLALQEFLIRAPGAAIEDVRFAGAEGARAAPGALRAIETADVIVIGPSNPVLSIGPILAVPGIRAALADAAAPVVAVSPIVGGTVLKGPTAACLRWAGHSCDASGVAAMYSGLLAAIVADEPVAGLPCLVCDTLLDTPQRRGALAAALLDFAGTL